MYKSDIDSKLQTLAILESETAVAIAEHLWANYSGISNKIIDYAVNEADGMWRVGLDSKGLYFDGYAYDLYYDITKKAGLTPVEESIHPVYVQHLRYFNALPLHVLRELYRRLYNT